MKDYPLKKLKGRTPAKILIVFSVLVIAGCAGEAVRVEFPMSHPANAQAPESKFTPPQNPFQTDIAVMEEKPEMDSDMKHKMTKGKEQQKQHTGHQMGPKKEIQSDSDSKNNPAHKQSGNRHREQE